MELRKKIKAKKDLFRSCLSRCNVGVLAGTTQRAEMGTHSLAKKRKKRHRRNGLRGRRCESHSSAGAKGGSNFRKNDVASSARACR